MNTAYLKANRFARNVRERIRWLTGTKSKNGPDNHVVKLQRIRRYQRLVKATSLIETGTFFGQTTAFASRHFGNVVSIELCPILAQANQTAFRRQPNVNILCGDSRLLLADAVKLCRPPILFWLDGHYSGGNTAGAAAPCPIIDELKTIGDALDISQCALLIDDLRLFNGLDGYPKIDEVSALIKSIWNEAEIGVDQDAITVAHKAL